MTRISSYVTNRSDMTRSTPCCYKWDLLRGNTWFCIVVRSRKQKFSISDVKCYWRYNTESRNHPATSAAWNCFIIIEDFGSLCEKIWVQVCEKAYFCVDSMKGRISLINDFGNLDKSNPTTIGTVVHGRHVKDVQNGLDCIGQCALCASALCLKIFIVCTFRPYSPAADVQITVIFLRAALLVNWL